MFWNLVPPLNIYALHKNSFHLKSYLVIELSNLPYMGHSTLNNMAIFKTMIPRQTPRAWCSSKRRKKSLWYSRTIQQHLTLEVLMTLVGSILFYFLIQGILTNSKHLFLGERSTCSTLGIWFSLVEQRYIPIPYAVIKEQIFLCFQIA